MLRFALPAWVLLAAAHLARAQEPMVVHRIEGEVVIEARHATFTREALAFREGVRAVFGEDTLTANSLVLYPEQRRGEAAGNVVLRAVEGTLSARDLTFSWQPAAKGGSARNVRLDMAGVMLEAATSETIPGDPPRIVMTDVRGTNCGRERPLYEVRSPRVEFVPGREGVIRRPTIYVLGQRLLTLPTQRFNLDPRVRGLTLPSIAYRRGRGLGVRWDASVLLDEQTAFSGDAQAFKGYPPTVDLVITRSYLQPQRSTGLITPRSDLEERFRQGYFDNIRVSSPAAEDRRLAEERLTLSLATSLNHGTSNDRTSDRYSKALEAIYEAGGSAGSLGYQSSLRLQHIRRNEEPFRTRAAALGTVGLGSLPLGKGLYARARVDSAAFLGDTPFGWVRGEAGLVATPTKWLMLGGSFVQGVEGGDAMYPADRLYSKRAVHLRADLDFGTTKLSYLLKRDLDRREELTEYSASQVIGCLEAFVQYREFPSSYQLGVRLRTDEFLRMLRSRDLRRRQEPVPADPRIGPASGLVAPPAGATP